MPFVGTWEAERYLDYHFLYALVFFLPMAIFLHSLAGLEPYLFLFISVIFYYSLIEKTDVRHMSLYTLHPLFQFKVTSNSIPPCNHQLRVYSISISATADDIFFIEAIDKVIKPIAEHIR